MTPALTAARTLYPEAQIDVLVREGTQGVLRGSLAVNEVYLGAPDSLRAKRNRLGQLVKDIKLIRTLRAQKYDWVFEMGDNDRGRMFALLIGAKKQVMHTRDDKRGWAQLFFSHKSTADFGAMHRCEKDVDLLRFASGYTRETPPMQFDRSFVDWSWVQHNLSQAPIVLHAATLWKRKQWPVERWQELVLRLSALAPIVITCGKEPWEIELSEKIASAAPGRVQITAGLTTWAQTAGLLYSARLLVCVDTAIFHLGGAVGVPTVALMGPTAVNQWGLWRCPGVVVIPPAWAAKMDAAKLIHTIEVEDVWRACVEVWAKHSVQVGV